MVSAKIFGAVLIRLTDGSERMCPYIDFEGEYWFVPEFIDDTNKPARIISPNDLQKRNPPPNIDAAPELHPALLYRGQRGSLRPRVIPEPDIEIENTD